MGFPDRVEQVHQPAAPVSADRAVALWLLVCAAMVLLIVVIGGVTRLTESGLSITEWKPVSGVVPPLTEQQWSTEFSKYQQTPEYQLLKSGMTLGEFKKIFFWEYLHRLWGRLVGIVFVIPFVFFLVRGRIQRAHVPRLAGIAVLIGLQGALGWYMVQSGLAERTDVSQYRLAAHLSLALVIYALMLWTGLSLLLAHKPGVENSAATAHAHIRAATARARAVLVLVSITIVSGAFVAGLNAGRIYNTFPLMNSRVVPPGYLAQDPWYLNFFENPVAVQFNHRLLAMLTLLASIHIWAWARKRELPAVARVGVGAIGIVAALQVLLGIATLLAAAPISLAAAHQTGAVLLLTAALFSLRGLTSAGIK